MTVSCAELLLKNRYPVRRTSSILQIRDIVKTFFKKGERIDGIISRNLGAYLIPGTELHKNSDYFVRQKPHGDFSAVFCRLIRGRLWRETTPAAGDTNPPNYTKYLFLCSCVEGNRADNRISSSYPVSRAHALEGGRGVGESPCEPRFLASPPALAKNAAWLGCQGLRSNRQSGLTLTDKQSRMRIKRQVVARPTLGRCGSDYSPFPAALAAVPGGVSRRAMTRCNIAADPRRAVCGAGLRQGARAANLRTTRAPRSFRRRRNFAANPRRAVCGMGLRQTERFAATRRRR